MKHLSSMVLVKQVRGRFLRASWVFLASLALVACGGGAEPGASPPPTAGPAAGTVTIVWNANAEPDLAGYRVYFGSASASYGQARGTGLNAGLATEYSVTGLTVGSTYYLAVTAYDSSANESGYSAEIVGVAR